MFKMNKMTVRAGLVVLAALAMILVGSTFAPSQVLAATAPTLGTAASFAVLGGSTVTNTGSTVVNGDLGVSPGSAVTGFPPGLVAGGTIHAADAAALQAKNDVVTAYNALVGQAVTADLTGQDLGGLTLKPGVYHFSSSAQLTGTLTLNALGNPNSVFIFQIGTTLTTASNSSVVMINGPCCNKFWQVGTSATLGTGTAFQGNILALASITMDTGAKLYGRAWARNGAVTMDTNVISIPVCNPTAAPSIGVVKSGILDMTVAGPSTRADAGDKINYTFVVTNTGNTILNNVTVSDIPALDTGTTPASVASLDPEDFTIFTGSYTLTQADINAGKVDDTATATGTPQGAGSDVTVQGSKTIQLGPSISLIKRGVLDMTVVSPDDKADVGDKINYTFTVTNTGSVTLTHVRVVDPMITITEGFIGSLAPGASTMFRGTYVLTETDINRGSVSNTAEVVSTSVTGSEVTASSYKKVILVPGMPGFSFWGGMAMILLLGGAMVLVIRRRQIRSETH